MEKEIWMPIDGYKDYMISSFGRIKSLKKGKETIMKPFKDSHGYMQIELSDKEKGDKIFLVHRLVAKAFLDNPFDFPQINHKDENKENNSATNLEYCTAKQNSNYGTRGERISRANSKPVVQLDKNMNVVKIWKSAFEAQKSGFHGGCISCCCNGKLKTHRGFIWKYLKDFDKKSINPET